MSSLLPEPNIMQELEKMRQETKAYFPTYFDSKKIWEAAMDEKYDYYQTKPGSQKDTPGY